MYVAGCLSVGLHAIIFNVIYSSPPVYSQARAKPAVTRVIEALKKPVDATTQPFPSQKQKTFAEINTGALSTTVTQPNLDTSQPQATLRTDLNTLLSTKVTRYLVSSEVDMAAQPVTDWVLQYEGLEPNLKVTVQLRIYVNDQGYLDNFEIINSSLGETMTGLLLQELRSTVFAPARKDGRTVASMRDIEITVDNSAIPYGIRRIFNNPQAK